MLVRTQSTLSLCFFSFFFVSLFPFVYCISVFFFSFRLLFFSFTVKQTPLSVSYRRFFLRFFFFCCCRTSFFFCYRVFNSGG